MPTGYTNIIDANANVTLRQYALRCARAFAGGREEPMDAPLLSTITANPYYETSYNKAIAELTALRAMTDAECDSAANDAYHATFRDTTKYNTENAALRERYAQMAGRVQRWAAPTPEHARLREFMLDQLDTGGPCDYVYNMPTTQTGAEWRNVETARLEKDVVHYREAFEKSRKNVAAGTAWAQALIDALPEEPEA